MRIASGCLQPVYTFREHNNVPLHLFQLLQQKYWRAIDCLHHQFVTKADARAGRGLAIHLTWHYLAGNYDLSHSTGVPGLLEGFFSLAPLDARDSVAWCVWRIAERKIQSSCNTGLG